MKRKGVNLMELEKNDAPEKENMHEQTKQPYTKPQLTIHGTVQEITGGKGIVLTDMGIAGSLLL